MKAKWVTSKNKINGHHTLENSVTKEICLFGLYGEIWASGPKKFKALIKSHRIARRYLPQQYWPVDVHDENLISFYEEDLTLWIERLKIPIKSSSQLKIANHAPKNEELKSNIAELKSENSSLEVYNQSK